MTASERVAEVFDQLLALDHASRAEWPFAHRVVWAVVACRCQIDIGGFETIWQDCLELDEVDTLVAGLRRIDEAPLAHEFDEATGALRDEGFFEHWQWERLTAQVQAQVKAAGERVGSRLWELDGRLVELLDERPGPEHEQRT